MWEAGALILLVLACLYWYDSLRARDPAERPMRAENHRRAQFAPVQQPVEEPVRE